MHPLVLYLRRSEYTGCSRKTEGGEVYMVTELSTVMSSQNRKTRSEKQCLFKFIYFLLVLTYYLGTGSKLSIISTR